MNKKQYARNKLFNLLIVTGILLGGLSAESFTEKDTAWAVGFCIAALVFLISAALFTPYCYAFDREGISLCYIFLPVERYLWRDIHAIEVEWHNGNAGKAHILEFFYASVFVIHGKPVGTARFYMSGHIRKSFRTKRLLETYWDGTITGYLFEDTKKWIQKRNKRKQKQIRLHLTDEIAPMEREIRAKCREWLSPLAAQAKQYNLELKTKYLYITKDFEELRSRPQEGYTYTLIMEVAHPGETDEERIYVVSIDLIYVRLGKTAYRGVINEHIEEELRISFTDALNEASKLPILQHKETTPCNA